MNLILFLFVLLDTMYCFRVVHRHHSLVLKQRYSLRSSKIGESSKSCFSSKQSSLLTCNNDHFETPSRTLISESPSPWKISHVSNIMLIGSCFSSNICEKLNKYKFSRTFSNPQGILFNPISIANCLENIICQRKFNENDLFLDHNQNHLVYHSYQHHSDYDAFSLDQGLEKINRDIEHAHNSLKKAHVLFITLGTAKVYSIKDNQDIVVANCHKRKWPLCFLWICFISLIYRTIKPV
jgi:hypothetical protein